MKHLILTVAIITLAAGLCLADVPPVLNHQGMLTDESGVPLTGDYYMVFRLYEVPVDGSEIWSEAQLVTVTDGVFNVYLGQVAYLDPDLFQGQDIYLGVTVADDSEMIPRLRLGSVPYAFAAQIQSGADTTWYEDIDGDGWGNPDVWMTSPNQPAGYVANNGDCDDDNFDVNPDALETCNGLDDDCNSQIDDGLVAPPCTMTTGVCAGTTMTCGGSQGWLACSTEDYGPDYELVESTCDGLDNDCDGIVDEDIICDDGNPCTIDACTPSSGCVFIADPGSNCDDGDPCTVNDQCDGQGSCYGDPVDCNDNIDCTLDYCDGAGGCTHELPSDTCLIDGQCYQLGDTNPNEECLECNPSVSANFWTSVVDGTLCTGGQCENGTCIAQFR